VCSSDLSFRLTDEDEKLIQRMSQDERIGQKVKFFDCCVE
jgi:hypothetical protein